MWRDQAITNAGRAIWLQSGVGWVLACSGHNHLQDMMSVFGSACHVKNSVHSKRERYWRGLGERDGESYAGGWEGREVIGGTVGQLLSMCTSYHCHCRWCGQSISINIRIMQNLEWELLLVKNTGKILHIGVWNKYCSVCAQGILGHFILWGETDIILDGFLKAEQTHICMEYNIQGLSVMVFLTLRENVPIWGRDVQKIKGANCNHACKCYRSSLEKLVTTSAAWFLLDCSSESAQNGFQSSLRYFF